ncbi:735_t:CDS:2 [Scutellospora calospora]|uniref:735_t:CDS:1 n=1 Tax=Scutellospora calospora TaxID=85575 RepID=A0ACA9JX08_9GLOM|nr:735_t:CDS:2 [Scutellospora calospora]
MYNNITSNQFPISILCKYNSIGCYQFVSDTTTRQPIFLVAAKYEELEIIAKKFSLKNISKYIQKDKQKKRENTSLIQNSADTSKIASLKNTLNNVQGDIDYNIDNIVVLNNIAKEITL